MSTIQTNCPHCMQQLAADDSILGQYVDCPACGKRFRLQTQPTAGTANGGFGLPRISMTVALVFQCIALAYSGIEMLMVFGEADEDALGVLALLGIVPIILALIFSCILHYKCWKVVPEGFARLTPGKAVGYLFIPFYNFYWAFPSFGGLGSDCAMVAAKNGLRGFASLSGLGLTYAILWVVNLVAQNIPVLGFFTAVADFVVWLLFYKGVVRLLNGLAAAGSAPQNIG